ncbi:MAG: AAA family ATPase [Phycisphaerae bacterium]|nr:AAA family ATPase [Phycisphaerae bacterium]
MNSRQGEEGARSYWFVGAMFDDDQTPRFIQEGIWENGYTDKYLDRVRAIQPGDRIAIKSSYTRKHDLPFDNRGQSVSVMAIKAIGTVTANQGDGRRVKVDWTQLDSQREWYFYTHRGTIWRVLPGEWMKDALIAFAFDGKLQEFRRFQNAPSWREHFGDAADDKHRFQWARFYEAVADKLLAFQHDRAALTDAIHAIAGRVNGLSYLQDQFADGTTGPLKDICPFTALGIFNRGITDANRKVIAKELATFLGVQEAVPETFEGIPVLNNQRSWFFGYEKNRQPDDIEALWKVFGATLQFAESDDPNVRDDFIKAFDDATSRHGVAWNLTVGMYWIRPWSFATLDKKSRQYLNAKLAIQINQNGHKHLPSATDYLTLLESLETLFTEEVYPVHSFPELSLAAWSYTDSATDKQPGQGDTDGPEDSTDVEEDTSVTGVPIQPYSVSEILDDGCFLERVELERLLERLRTKKNLILQGPPGTGKTWLARRLAFALMGQRDESRLRAIQFHPNMSYEDFVRGWRPSGDGKLDLVDGPFLQMIKVALQKPEMKFVLVIEEINRGHPAQISGEMLTLLEADKRTPTEAIELCYRREPGERVFIPGNLYVIGTMNIADRSLALVDLALRRRFAFVDLEPRLGTAWRAWVTSRCVIEPGLLDEIEKRILALNEQIAADSSLGKQFRIGHSYVTPPRGIQITDPREWFKQVVETEIGPLLDEYWFDATDKARDARKHLTEGL